MGWEYAEMQYSYCAKVYLRFLWAYPCHPASLYRSYSLRFLLIVLRSYFTRSGSVEGLCAHYGITISTLNRWLCLFRQQKELWLGVLEDRSVPAVPFIDAMDVPLLKAFFLAFRFSYLESPRVTDPEMPPRKQQHPGSIT